MTMQRYEEPDSRISVGATGMGAGDFIPPRVKVVQQMSQEAQGDKDARKASAGEFFDTLRGISYGNKLRFIPLFPFMNRVFIVREKNKAEANAKLEAAGLGPLPDGDGLMCRSLDMVHGQGDPGILCDECPMSKWEGRTGAPPCSETYNLAAMTEQGEVIFLSFSRSSAKVGKRVNSMMRLSTSRPWARIWEATTTLERNDQGTYYVPDVVQTADVTPTELLAEAANFARQFQGAPIDMAESEAAATEEAPTKQPF